MRSKLAAIALLLLLVALFWWRHGASGASGTEEGTKPGDHAATAADRTDRALDANAAHERKSRRQPAKEPVPHAPRADVLAEYSAEAEVENGTAALYRQKNLTGYYAHLRGALNGNSEDLDAVFTTYFANGEGYGGDLKVLLVSLGDEYFSYHLAHQSDETQAKIMSSAWGEPPGIDTKRFDGVYERLEARGLLNGNGP